MREWVRRCILAYLEDYAEAHPSLNLIASVQFFANNTLIGTASAPAFSVSSCRRELRVGTARCLVDAFAEGVSGSLARAHRAITLAL